MTKDASLLMVLRRLSEQLLCSINGGSEKSSSARLVARSEMTGTTRGRAEVAVVTRAGEMQAAL